jgi:hypothetical protein
VVIDRVRKLVLKGHRLGALFFGVRRQSVASTAHSKIKSLTIASLAGYYQGGTGVPPVIAGGRAATHGQGVQATFLFTLGLH